MFRWVWSLAGAVSTALVIGAGIAADTWFSHHEIYETNTQPESVEYDGAIYHVGVVRRESWLLRRRLSDEVWVSRDPGLSYGHVVGVDIAGNSTPMMRSVQWRPDGVTVRFDSGHELFLPARSFVGGR